MLERDIEKLNAGRLLLTQDRNEKEHEKLNIDKLLNFIKYYMEHFSELLLGSNNPLENASFFGLMFEERPTYYDLVNGTPKLSSLFKLNEEYEKSKNLLVTPRRIELRFTG